MKKFLGILILLSFPLQAGLPAGFFELGYSARHPVQLETIFDYENRVLYYNEITKQMEKFPTEPVAWNYERYKVKLRLGYNFTYNMRVRFTFPYIYSDLQKTDSIGQLIRVNRGAFTDFIFEFKYDFFKTKTPLWGFWSQSTLNISYMFDSGTDDLLADSISLGEDYWLFDLRLSFTPFKNFKNLILKMKTAYQIYGYKRPNVEDSSKSGWNDGNVWAYELRASYVVNNFWKTELYIFDSEYGPYKDLYGNIVEDSDEYKTGVGTIITYRPYGDSSFSVYGKYWYTFRYKLSYVAFINPEIGILYMF